MALVGTFNPTIGSAYNIYANFIAEAANAVQGRASMPAEIIAGDLIVVVTTASLSSSGTPVIANNYGNGFTMLADEEQMVSTTVETDHGAQTTFHLNKITVSYKIATGTEGSTFISGFLSANRGVSITLVYRPSNRPITNVSWQHESVIDIRTPSSSSHTIGGLKNSSYRISIGCIYTRTIEAPLSSWDIACDNDVVFGNYTEVRGKGFQPATSENINVNVTTPITNVVGLFGNISLV